VKTNLTSELLLGFFGLFYIRVFLGLSIPILSERQFVLLVAKNYFVDYFAGYPRRIGVKAVLRSELCHMKTPMRDGDVEGKSDGQEKTACPVTLAGEERPTKLPIRSFVF
jgi:hypothetical protein